MQTRLILYVMRQRCDSELIIFIVVRTDADDDIMQQVTGNVTNRTANATNATQFRVSQRLLALSRLSILQCLHEIGARSPYCSYLLTALLIFSLDK